jgi:hypothetical protein
MKWQDIKVSADNTHFIFQGRQIFEKQFIEVLKFHAPGLAPVKDETGSYHIDMLGHEIYGERFTRTFGFYCNRAAVVLKNKCYHMTETGKRAYDETYNWTGNYQENLCSVRDGENRYHHIDLDGEKIYKDSFVYCGDYKDGYACVKTDSGLYKHIDDEGNFLNDKAFLDLGIFHKNFATARDENGWFHINKSGEEIYSRRYMAVEPFYNGFALVTEVDKTKLIIDEQGQKIISI